MKTLNIELINKAIALATNFEGIEAIVTTGTDSNNCPYIQFHAKTTLDVSPVVRLTEDGNNIKVNTRVSSEFDENQNYSDDFLYFSKFSNHLFTDVEFIELVNAFSKDAV